MLSNQQAVLQDRTSFHTAKRIYSTTSAKNIGFKTETYRLFANSYF